MYFLRAYLLPGVYSDLVRPVAPEAQNPYSCLGIFGPKNIGIHISKEFSENRYQFLVPGF